MHLPALLAFLGGLRENNNKAWFVMNKPAYDILRPEFTVLVRDVIARLARTDPHVAHVDPRKALFRIHRDIRFSNDKTPYKTRFSASIADGEVKHWGPMYYLSIDADGQLHVGAGCWLPPRDVLLRIRRHVLADPGALEKVLRGRKFKATFGTLSDEDRLMRLPKGYDVADADVARAAEWLRLKSYVAGTTLDLTAKAHAADADDLPAAIADRMAAATPLNDWLRRTPDA